MGEGQWVTAWLGRGPLSTTITTDHTFQDPVPHLGGRTLRLVAHLAIEGCRVRVRLSQRFSNQALEVAESRIALSHGGTAVWPATDRPLTFGASPTALVPAGGDLWSDPVDLSVPAGDVALSFFIPGAFVPTTQGGRGQTKTSYHAPGNQASATELHDAEPTRQVFVAYEVQVWSPIPACTVVALGDSITEGACSTLDRDAGWPELLGRRLPWLPDGRKTSLVNAGIGSGRWASSDAAGTRGLVRLTELLTLPNLAWVIVHMGVNDISYEGVGAPFLIEAFTQALHAAHRSGVLLTVVPILPFGGSVKDVGTNVVVAQQVNAWLRAHGPADGPGPHFDAVLDGEAALLAPVRGWALHPDLTEDGVHPNQAGYQALANAFPLQAFSAPPRKAH